MSGHTLHDNNRFLRRVLLGNALFETACGLGGIIGGSMLAEGTGLLPPVLFTIIGAGCLAYAMLLYWMSAQTQINRTLTRVVLLFNELFAVATVLLLLAGWGSLAEGARWLLALLAVDASILAALEYEGLRRTSPREQVDVYA